MLDIQGEIQRAVGRKSDAAAAAGSIVARLQELLANRITTARAAFLDAAISSRAAAATALSTADYTGGRAANLDAAVSSRAAAATALSTADYTAGRAANLDAAISGLLSAAVNSIQYGSIAITNATGVRTATISSVVTSKSTVIFLGFSASGYTLGSQPPILTLTNSTTVSTQDYALGSIYTILFAVVEWK